MGIKRIIEFFLKKLRGRIIDDLDFCKFQNGCLLSEVFKQSKIDHIHQAEFKVFSQFGDDGIIQYLINKVDISNKFFVEFGVENYSESTTRFLMQKDNWSGLVFEGHKPYVEDILKSNYYWKYDLTAACEFITRENINDLLVRYKVPEKIGILHIDIDGNEYWVWKVITAVDPDIVIIEYNSVFGQERSITIPYDPNFTRTEYHYTNLCFGASLKALYDLSQEKGYACIGCNSSGNNAYFVKKNKLGGLKELDLKEAYVKSKFRESRDKENKFTFISGEKRIESIKDLDIWDIDQGKMGKI